jgi:Ca-activated chloride channel family protein
VKIQVEFNPAQASAYRLIGYENRVLAKEDFNDDKKDAGEIGAGHSVTALYEVVPAGGAMPGATTGVDELKYAPKAASAPVVEKSEVRGQRSEVSPEMLTLKLRYKKPDGDVSTKLEFPLTDRGETWEKSSKDFRWAAAVASFGMLLRDSPHKGRTTWDSTLELAHEGKGEDATGYRTECVALIEKARVVASAAPQ